MMRPNLAARLAQAAASTPSPPPAEMQASQAPVEDRAPGPARSSGRRNKTMVAGYFSPELATAVKMLALERRVTLQALIGEGLDEVLRKYGRRPMGER